MKERIFLIICQGMNLGSLKMFFLQENTGNKRSPSNVLKNSSSEHNNDSDFWVLTKSQNDGALESSELNQIIPCPNNSTDFSGVRDLGALVFFSMKKIQGTQVHPGLNS